VSTTAGQEARLRLVADQFNRPTRRRVKRQVLRGSPPLHSELSPLASAYADYLAWTVGQSRPTRQFRLQLALGLFWIVAATADIIVMGPSVSAVIYLTIGIVYVAVIAPLSKRETVRSLEGLRQSRSMLGLKPLPHGRGSGSAR